MRRATQSNGVAMVVVLWVILLLSLLIGGFAFTMHVETELTSFNRKQLKAEMIARSGVEVARLMLILDVESATEGGTDSLNQQWATNATFYVDHALGDGVLNVTVRDEESKFPINRASPEQVRRLLDLIGIDPSDADVIADSIVDWTDEDELHQLNGAEDEYYQSLEPPYHAKNAPLDRVEELLLVRGVTPEILYGVPPSEEEEEGIPGLIDLVTTTSAGKLNINTATSIALKAVLGLDDLQVEAILNRRDGGDGIAGTEDDEPFKAMDEFVAVLGRLNDEVVAKLGDILTTQSTFFFVRAEGKVGNVKRTLNVILRRNGPQVIPVTWEQVQGG